MSKPVITVPHDVLWEGDEVHAYVHAPEAFYKMMGHIYPTIAAYSPPKHFRVFSFFNERGLFLGAATECNIYGVKCFNSYRKNPFYQGDRDDMLKALLALNRYIYSDVFYGFSSRENYPSLKLFQRLGLGAKPLPDGRRVMTTAFTEESAAELERMLSIAKRLFAPLKEEANYRLCSVRGECIPKLEDMPEKAFSASVELK